MKAVTLRPERLAVMMHLGVRCFPFVSSSKGLIGQRIALHAGQHIGGAPNGFERAAELARTAGRAGWDVVIERPDAFRWRRADDAGGRRSSRIRLGQIVATAVLVRTEPVSNSPWGGAAGDSTWWVEDLVEVPPLFGLAGQLGVWELPLDVAGRLEPPVPGSLRRWLDVSIPCPACGAGVRVYSACKQPPELEVDAPPWLVEADLWVCEGRHRGGVGIVNDRTYLLDSGIAEGGEDVVELVEEYSARADLTPLASALRRGPLASLVGSRR